MVQQQQVLVVGLGRFGSALALELEKLGHEVLAVDVNEELVNDIARDVTHALELDASDESALRAAGAADFAVAVVAISSNAEASIFATMALKNLGVPTVIAKAGSAIHGSILERVGASRVVYPERDMGIQVAHTFTTPHVLDYLEVAPNVGVEKIQPPRTLVGRTLAELDLPRRHGVTPLVIRRGDEIVVNPDGNVRVESGDELVLLGPDDRLHELRET